MRILVVHNQLWAHYKSVLFEEIQNEISLNYPGSEFLVAQIALYEKSREAMTSDQQQIPYSYPYQLLFQKSLDAVSLGERTRALFRLFRSYRPDVLNITGYFDYAQVALLLYARFLGVKTVISSESSEVDKPRTGYKETLKKLFLRQADAFIGFGTTSVNYLKSLGVDEKKIVVRKAAVVDNDRILEIYRQEKLANPVSTPSFIYVGRLAEEKNLLRLLQAYATLIQQKEAEDWGLILVGEGPQRQELEQYVAMHALNGVTFTGGVSWQEVPAWLAKASVLVLPSISEPWGLVVNEAMLCGMPVIVSEKCGCAHDLVKKGSNGFLIDPLDVNSLVDSMRYYTTTPAAVTRHGSKSIKLIQPFSPESVAREIVLAYHALRP
ncbi:MAG: glycosyltransferase family 4 protein [Bacteroidetes bacterium]|nr:glycosyltransferase family 4 protein [Bacteroidota bacterium]